MDEFLGFIIVLGILGLLIYSLIRRIKEFRLADGEKVTSNSGIMIISLFAIILFYSLNILVGIGVIVNEYVTSNSTSIGAFISFGVYGFARFRLNNEKQTANRKVSLLK